MKQEQLDVQYLIQKEEQEALQENIALGMAQVILLKKVLEEGQKNNLKIEKVRFLLFLIV